MDSGWLTGGDPMVVHESRIATSDSSEIHKMFRLGQRLWWFPLLPPRKHVFVRKVIRVFGAITQEMLELQLDTIDKLNTTDHKNILRVLDKGWIPRSSFYYFDMEFCLSDLDSVIRSGKTDFTYCLNPAVRTIDFAPRFKHTIQIAYQIIAGLAFIHSHGQVHRRLKPKNILYSAKDNRWKLSDYGLMAINSPSMSLKSPNLREPVYHPPESHSPQGTFEFTIDIWAFGCILFEMATQRAAFQDEEELRKVKAGRGATLTFSSDFRDIDKDITTAVSATEILVQDLIEVDPQRRPSAEEASKRIECLIGKRG